MVSYFFLFSYTDLVVGAPFHYGRSTGGAIYIYMNSRKGLQSDTKPLIILGKPESRFGFAIEETGDLNKDGYTGEKNIFHFIVRMFEKRFNVFYLPKKIWLSEHRMKILALFTSFPVPKVVRAARRLRLVYLPLQSRSNISIASARSPGSHFPCS